MQLATYKIGQIKNPIWSSGNYFSLQYVLYIQSFISCRLWQGIQEGPQVRCFLSLPEPQMDREHTRQKWVESDGRVGEILSQLRIINSNMANLQKALKLLPVALLFVTTVADGSRSRRPWIKVNLRIHNHTQQGGQMDEWTQGGKILQITRINKPSKFA